MRQAECRTCQRMEASDPKVVPDIGTSQTSPSNTLPAILQKPLLRPMQGLCAAVGEIPPWYRKWLKIAISSFARASERLSKLRNIRYRELAMPHRPLLPHPPSWIKPPAQSPNHTSIFGPPRSPWIPDILSISRAFTHWETRQGLSSTPCFYKVLTSKISQSSSKRLILSLLMVEQSAKFQIFGGVCRLLQCQRLQRRGALRPAGERIRP